MPDPAAAEIFADYADVYDAIYAAKDYRREAGFVLDRLRGPEGALPSTLLEIGSGTGRHMQEFAREGVQVTGLDRSRAMTAIARQRIASVAGTVPCAVADGDVRDFHLGQRFAAATALFHVTSYLTTTADLLAGFASIRRHLNLGVPFFFDFWHLPGVKLDPPSRRDRTFATPSGTFIRIMDPTWREPVVTLEIGIDGELAGRPVRIREQHQLRAWMPAELEAALSASGFVVDRWGAALDPQPLSERDWLGWALARAC